MRLSPHRSTVDIRPTSPERDDCIIIVPGWGEPASLLRPFAEQLAARTGLRTIVIGRPRWQQPFWLTSPRGPRKTTGRQVWWLAQELDRLKITNKPLHLVGHSAGALSAVHLARESSLTIASLHLMSPSGLMQNDRFVWLTGRIMRKSLHNVRYARQFKHPQTFRSAVLGNLLGIWYFVLNPFRGLMEALATLEFNLATELQGLTTLRPSMSTTCYLALDDLVYPRGRLVSCPNGTTRFPGTHDHCYLRPSEAARLVSEQLSA